jgi:hypothetical protein
MNAGPLGKQTMLMPALCKQESGSAERHLEDGTANIIQPTQTRTGLLGPLP